MGAGSSGNGRCAAGRADRDHRDAVGSVALMTRHVLANLAGGVESIADLSVEEIRAAGVPDTISRLPGYVNRSPLLDHVDEFDAEFFGFSARDAALTDPQHRLFLETCWEALEDAGYDPATYPGAIGLSADAS
jgi:acyl transferase domain-containing protein